MGGREDLLLSMVSSTEKFSGATPERDKSSSTNCFICSKCVIEECPAMARNLFGYFAPSRSAPKPPMLNPAMNNGEVSERHGSAVRAAAGTSSTIHFSKFFFVCGT